MDFFAVPYDIHFDDTMAYGSHHFLTNFKFQCAGREHLLFSPHAFEVPEFRRDFDQVLLLTYEGYSRNLSPAALGDRLVVLTSLEERGEVSLRFCFRTLKRDGTPVACGYQTVLCADRQGALRAFPESFQRSFESLAALHEPAGPKSFRDLALQGGSGVQALFPEAVRELARTLLADAAPRGVSRTVRLPEPVPAPGLQLPANATAFLFAGQGTFEPALFLQLKALQPELREELRAMVEACRSQGIDVTPLLAAEDVTQVGRALDAAPLLDQLGIFLCGVLGARWMERQGTRPDVFVGHSFGEIAAMTAAGALDLRTGAEVVCRRIRALQTVPDDLGTLAAVAMAEPETVRAIAECGARTLEVAGRNHSRQTVVAGPREELERLRAFLERQGKGFTFISSRYPFHHPSLGPAVAAFRSSLADLTVHPARGPVYSPIERRVYGGGRSELSGALASHLVRPFDFAGAVETLAGAGCTRFVDCGTGGRLTRIVQRILPSDSPVALASLDQALPVSPPAAAPVARDAAAGVPAIAVVSLGCMLPGGAKDPETYWRNIQRGISGIVDTGLSHPDQVGDFVGPAVTPDRTYTLLTGRVLDADLVPPPGISPERFQRYGREQRLLAIALSQAMESMRSGSPGRIQCLLGSTADGSPEYDDALCVEAGEALLRARGETAREFSALMREALGVTATASELAPHPTLQAVVTDIVGPGVSTMLLDAACASSLYAIALGMKALERGEADLVLAGGVFSPGPGNSCLFSQFKGLSATGSRPFDERADGVIFGEGAGVVGLMRLEDAVSSGRKVHAVIRGAGLSSDGRSSSANVPRADGQVAAMEACYAAAGVEVASIQYIEAHGTATPAGDTTELQSIGRVFGGKRKGVQLASVKALIGHVGWAAGAASVIKLCKALEHRSFPPQSHFDRPGAGLRALGPDFEVSTREQPWPGNGDHPRRAATNGFGFGGTNAHLVLEEYRGGTVKPHARAVPTEDSALVVVAAEGMFPEARFDARELKLPASVRLLPDITEDMDLTQHLGLIVASDVVTKLGAFDSLRTGTAIVLGLEGKTRRGVEATQRVLADSTRRRLREHVQRTPDAARLLPLVDRLHAAVGALRPSGPYTLQGMMPNVTPGRVAGALDTKGPNFVVDAGAGTLAASLRASRALLDSGFELVLVGSTHVRRPGEGPTASTPDEGVAMLAVTTAAKAEARGLKPLCQLRMSEATGTGPGITLPPHSAREAQEVLRAVRAAAEGRATTLRFHPDAATGARLELQLRPGLSARPEAPAEAQPTNWSDSRTSWDNRGGHASAPDVAGAPPRHPSNGTRSDSRTSVEAHAGEARTAEARPPSSHSVPEASEGFDHSAPIGYHAPVLVERRARTSGASQLRGRRVLFIAQDEALARELSAQAHEFCGPEFRILHAGSTDAGSRIHGIDLTREETAEAGLDALGFDPQVILAVSRMASGAGESTVVADTALRHEALELLFLSARRAYAGLTAGTVTLASLCIGGVGERRTLHPVTGLFAGLLKSLAREVPARGIRAIATTPLPLLTALGHVASELGTGDDTAPVEVCFDGPVRCVRLLQPTEVPARPAATLDSQSVVLLTGGGRGVTAVLAGALLKRYGCKVVLLGRSDPSDAPERVLQARDEDLGAVEREFYASELARDNTVRMPALRARFERHLAVRELRATLDGLTRLPGQMTYRAADVTRPEEVDRVVEELLREHGRLDLVVHGAGTQVSKKLHRRKLTELRGTLDTKLLGLRNLRESCARRLPAPVPFHVLTSAFSYIGNDGQADYGAANEALDRLCAWVSDASQGVRWCSVGWLAWDGIGMTRGSEYKVLGASRKLRGIRAGEGEALFLQLVDGQPVQPINVQLTESERAFYGLEVLAPPPPTPEPPRPSRRALTVDAASVPCLEDHLVRGTPTLPGAWALDLMFQAALDDARPELRTVTIEDVRFSRFIRVKPGGQQSLRAECTPLTDNPGQHSVQVKLTGDVVHASGVVLERDLVYAEARFTLTAEPPRTSPRLEAARASGHGVSVHDPHCAAGSPIELRRMFDCLEEIRLEQDARFARLGLPEAPRQAGHGVPALVLDAALRLSAMHVEGVSNDVFAPIGVQRATFDRDLVAPDARAPRRLTLKALAPRVEGELLQCGTVAAHDEAGRLRMLVEGGIARPMA
ncbi:type I polyketide synthase [Corallococcus aberystwythensis]|uniref:SDR family NAD(P)-dependent oxidoreductase n=1 Tax=Corallococcus aberystwythensis TaxID=2316722 RepID=A0A3A8QNT2_9BACT|nr:type I polyketide synthase [Corallococcus aberystwythensis]RKH70323.1 SDR family NAD(P)-dependent oxidoreductase [Corallococcus aberystwythensis]